jgi:hypothetical protein
VLFRSQREQRSENEYVVLFEKLRRGRAFAWMRWTSSAVAGRALRLPAAASAGATPCSKGRLARSRRTWRSSTAGSFPVASAGAGWARVSFDSVENSDAPRRIAASRVVICWLSEGCDPGFSKPCPPGPSRRVTAFVPYVMRFWPVQRPFLGCALSSFGFCRLR